MKPLIKLSLAALFCFTATLSLPPTHALLTHKNGTETVSYAAPGIIAPLTMTSCIPSQAGMLDLTRARAKMVSFSSHAESFARQMHTLNLGLEALIMLTDEMKANLELFEIELDAQVKREETADEMMTLAGAGEDKWRIEEVEIVQEYRM
ncbi:MAG: hypothetical protein M1818_006021 [Claussenomyces sp. TS43310]|nr:MAG: hypothetical protein M1818_006021 [Claussenomyces sp. TS43310]